MPKTLVINGWTIYFHPCFIAQMDSLIARVERDKAKQPETYTQKNPWLRLVSIVQIIRDEVPNDPGHARFRQGTTLGGSNTEWRRVKFGGQRYRLFFRFHSADKIIAIGWVNDENTVRTYGSNTDAYTVFRSMLTKNNPPTDWAALLAECQKAHAQTKILHDRLGPLLSDDAGT
ncbi:MAG: type II toxin-antitoxin system YhaV family toxin [Alphaproteobacteria bacterium]|nr:type II toxin-antitoxin system YhaV family toxin [Alphaproteobacteria bacterium]